MGVGRGKGKCFGRRKRKGCCSYNFGCRTDSRSRDFGDQWNESSLVKFGNFFSFSLKEFEGEFLSLLQMIKKKNKGTG